jgi:plasmid stabilization system protein ParE
MNKLRLSPLAREDLQDVKAYITDELQSPDAAANAVARITSKIRSLINFPMMGPSLSSIVDLETDYRFLVCGNYTAFYRYNEDTVYIVRVLYGRRDFMRILFGDNQKDDEQ